MINPSHSPASPFPPSHRPTLDLPPTYPGPLLPTLEYRLPTLDLSRPAGWHPSTSRALHRAPSPTYPRHRDLPCTPLATLYHPSYPAPSGLPYTTPGREKRRQRPGFFENKARPSKPLEKSPTPR